MGHLLVALRSRSVRMRDGPAALRRERRLTSGMGAAVGALVLLADVNDPDPWVPLTGLLVIAFWAVAASVRRLEPPERQVRRLAHWLEPLATVASGALVGIALLIRR